MNTRKLAIPAVSLIAAALAAAAPAQAGNPASSKNSTGDIVDVAVSAGQFGTLAKALTAAGLVETLKGKGPYTVFAPTDEAFARLPAGTLESLLAPENRQQLIDVLTYHVVPGKVTASEVVGLSEAPTVQGDTIDIRVDGTRVMVDQATVTTTDIAASNGVIHVIDAVILPGDAS